MTTILGIQGSPRKGGNTHTLLRQVRAGAVAAGGAMEIVSLQGLDIAECDGCHVCWQEKACAKKDDMNAIFPRVAGAHVVVFGTPVYWYGPTALMKGFIDRFVFFNCDANRPGIQGKRAAIVVPCEETSPETAAPVEQFFEASLAYLGMNLEGRLIAPGVTKRGEVKQRPDLMETAFALGERLAR